MNARCPIPFAGIPALLVSFTLTTACSSAGVAPNRTGPGSPGLGSARKLALIDARSVNGLVITTADLGEKPADRLARILVLDLGRDGAFEVVDARKPGFHLEVGADAARTAALVESVPADAYLSLQVHDCLATVSTETQRHGTGTDTADVQLFSYRGDCEAGLKVQGPDGTLLADVRKRGRWDSPSREAATTREMYGVALEKAVDAVTRQLADSLRNARGD